MFCFFLTNASMSRFRFFWVFFWGGGLFFTKKKKKKKYTNDERTSHNFPLPVFFLQPPTVSCIWSASCVTNNDGSDHVIAGGVYSLLADLFNLFFLNYSPLSPTNYIIACGDSRHFFIILPPPHLLPRISFNVSR